MKKLSMLLIMTVLITGLFSAGLSSSPVFAAVPYGLELHVSLAGSDSGDGSLQSPFLSLDKARDVIRALKISAAGLPAGGVVVWIHGGVYQRTETFTLKGEDSGTADNPIAYKAFPGDQVRILGGRTLPVDSAVLTTSSSDVWNRLDLSARGKVYQIDASILALNGYGNLKEWSDKASAIAPVSLFMNRKPMILARWPDPGVNVADYTPNDATIVLKGSTNAQVSGTYLKYGVSDGVNAYKRSGLVKGKQYWLSRSTWINAGISNTAWFLKTDNNAGYPKTKDPWWYCYSSDFTLLNPSGGGTGTLLVHRPEAIRSGFTTVSSNTKGNLVTYYGTRPERWASAEDLWLNGYWKYNYVSTHVSVTSVNTLTRTLTTSDLPDAGTALGQPFYAENLLEEITMPGEWYMNRKTGMIWFWPTAPVQSSELAVSTFAGDLVSLYGTAYVTFSGLVLEMSRGNIVSVVKGDHVTFTGCNIRNAGADGVILDGTDCSVSDSEIAYTGRSGINVGGGVRTTLTPANNLISRNLIHNVAIWQWMGEPAVQVTGVGQTLSGNIVRDAPGFGIMVRGNNHLVENNNVYNVCRFCNDSGAIYFNSNWSFRGTTVRYNYVHDISTLLFGSDVNGIYLDDCVSGISVFGNLVRNVAGAALKNGGGRDNRYENNVVLNSGSAFSVDSRGLQRINNKPGDTWNLLERLRDDGVQYKDAIWAAAYPSLAAIPDSWAIVGNRSNSWLYPMGTVISRNIGFNNKKWIAEALNGGTGTLNKLKENSGNIQNKNPLFVNEKAGNFNLLPASPAFAIKGFVKIPFNEIGIGPSGTLVK